MVQTSYPGVYVEEFAPAPPIQPAGTSVAAFVGVAAGGDIKVPTRVTSFNQFVATFGNRPINGFYLWYAVRGFFENGGRDCFVVRASNGRYARDVLQNANGDVVFKLRSVQPGDPKPITITAASAHRLAPDKLRVFTIEEQPVISPDNRDPKKVNLGPGAISGKNGAFLFRPGDVVEVKPTGEQATVLGVDVSKPPGATANNNAIRLDRVISGLDATKSIQLAPVPLGALSLTMEYVNNAGEDDPALPAEALVPGALLTVNPSLPVSQQEVGVVDAVGAVFLPNPDGGQAKRLYQVTFRDTLNKGLRRDHGTPTGVQSEEFTLTVAPPSGAPKTYANLATDPLHPRYAPDYVNARDASLRLEEIDPPPPGGPDKLLPADGAPAQLGGTPAKPLKKDLVEQGADEKLTDMPTSPNDFIEALNTLTTIPDVFNVAVPDVAAMTTATDATAIQQAVVAHSAGNMGDRFGVLDAFAPDQEPFADKDLAQHKKPDSIETQRGKLLSARGYAALYYPWIRVLPASRGPLVSVPPSGHVCGMYARIDNTRGVHKAPAREQLFGTVAIAKDLSNVDHGVLNLQGINVIRTFTKGGQPVVFGARTTTSDTNWQYVNVRRLFLFLERSITANLRSTVFEPNTTELWGRLNRTISAFLLEQWHNGALFGAKPDQAFYVKIDESLNPFTDRQLGKLTIEIGVQPTYPAEFIIVRIGIWDGVSSVQEG